MAVLLVFCFKSQFYTLIGKELEFELFSHASHLVSSSLGAVGLGSYPASIHLFILPPLNRWISSVEEKCEAYGEPSFRKALTVFQFSMSILLIVGTLTVTRQLRYINGLDLGF